MCKETNEWLQCQEHRPDPSLSKFKKYHKAGDKLYIMCNYQKKLNTDPKFAAAEKSKADLKYAKKCEDEKKKLLSANDQKPFHKKVKCSFESQGSICGARARLVAKGCVNKNFKIDGKKVEKGENSVLRDQAAQMEISLRKEGQVTKVTWFPGWTPRFVRGHPS